jgi:hypothetical protein
MRYSTSGRAILVLLGLSTLVSGPAVAQRRDGGTIPALERTETEVASGLQAETPDWTGRARWRRGSPGDPRVLASNAALADEPIALAPSRRAQHAKSGALIGGVVGGILGGVAGGAVAEDARDLGAGSSRGGGIIVGAVVGALVGVLIGAGIGALIP